MNAEYQPFDRHDSRHWVPHRVLRVHAAQQPDKAFVLLDGTDHSFTFAEMDRRSDCLAAGMQSMGVSPDDRVGVFLPNGIEYIDTWLGLSKTGAVHVAINTEYKGVFLRHVLENSQAGVLICAAAYLPRLSEIETELTCLHTIVVVGEVETTLRRLRVIGFAEVMAAPRALVEVAVSSRETGCIMYTSGTTGPSKGVLMPHAHNYLFGLGIVENLELTAKDIYYIALPLFHANGMFMQLYAALILGATAVVKVRFSASAWIGDILKYQATVTNNLGVMNEFLLKQPPGPNDHDHGLQTLAVAPNTPDLAARFGRRFGIRNVVGVYGMTEANIPLYTEIGADKPGSCGREYSRYFDVRIFDPDTDEECSRNEVGEIVVRPRQAFGFMTGYNRLPEKTVEAWRNFWFHTGDAATMDEDGYVFFVDRIKDCIRCRGENISSYEVEAVLLEHPAVAEVAVIAVRSEIAGGEDEVKAVIVVKTGAGISYVELLEYCRRRMPKFAVPRFFEFVPALPKTPTEKVRKHILRESGITSTTWDRDAG